MYWALSNCHYAPFSPLIPVAPLLPLGPVNPSPPLDPGEPFSPAAPRPPRGPRSPLLPLSPMGPLVNSTVLFRFCTKRTKKSNQRKAFKSNVLAMKLCQKGRFVHQIL
uniref:Uncharacterized protein n=1 Tax=Gouania willdenowi TaxID=441366 RepID=A0A8C5H6W0_GOUWI